MVVFLIDRTNAWRGGHAPAALVLWPYLTRMYGGEKQAQ